jgi:hypothetical protein
LLHNIEYRHVPRGRAPGPCAAPFSGYLRPRSCCWSRHCVTGERRSVSAATPPRAPDRPSLLPLVHRRRISVLELRVGVSAERSLRLAPCHQKFRRALAWPRCGAPATFTPEAKCLAASRLGMPGRVSAAAASSGPEVRAAIRKGPLRAIAYPQDGTEALGQGSLLLVNNQISQASGTVELKATFPNKNGKLWPGEFVQVRLVTSVRRSPRCPTCRFRPLPSPRSCPGPTRRPWRRRWQHRWRNSSGKSLT